MKTETLLRASNLGLDMESPANRLIRRAVVTGLIAFVATLQSGVGDLSSAAYVGVIVAVLAMSDKFLRDYLAMIE